MVSVRSPGRVNLIGEHTDYNGGWVLPLAIDRWVQILAAPIPAREIRIHSRTFADTVAFPLERIEPQDPPHWGNYPRAVVWALRKAGHEVSGAAMLVAGDLPPSVGLGSSAALETAMALSLLELVGSSLSREAVASLCQAAEEGFVGVHCGIMDQMASLLAREGHALLLDCQDLTRSWVRIPPEATIMVVDSDGPRSLRDSSYNQRRRECRQAADLLGVETLREVSAGDLEDVASRLPPPLLRRVRHVVTENQRVAKAARALEKGDLSLLGELMLDSHASLRDDYEVSTPELDLLVETAASVDGVYGARLTGAGFGGSTVNLTRSDAAAPFAERVGRAYRDATGRVPQIYRCSVAGGASVSQVADAAQLAGTNVA